MIGTEGNKKMNNIIFSKSLFEDTHTHKQLQNNSTGAVIKVFMRPHWNTEKGVMRLACLEENLTRERTLKLLLEQNNPTCKFPKARQYGACLGNSEIPNSVEEGFFIYATLFSQHSLFKALDMH